MLKILETPGYICNQLRLLSQDRFDNVELPVRVENHRCSRYFEPQLNVSGKHLKFCLSSMPVCLASTTNTARQAGFVCQCSKTSFLLSTSKNCLSSTYFCGGQTDIVPEKQNFTFAKQCLFVWPGL